MLGETRTISDLPSYTKYWRNKFERRMEELGGNNETSCNETILNSILLQYTTCLQMDVSETDNQVLPDDNSSSHCKQNYYFLSDVLPEDKVYRSSAICCEIYL